MNSDDQMTRTLIWLLMWSVIFVCLLIGLTTARMEREDEKRHAAVMASMNPPEVVICREPRGASK